MALPLEGIRVLDLSRLLPGPFGTQILADFGADVIKIEDTEHGDGFRHAGPNINGVSARHMTLNRNKRCLSLNLKMQEGRQIFLDLAREADVVLEQFRPGVMERLGLGYEAVRAVRPQIVYCSLSGFGQDGPYRTLAAHDPNYMSLSGILSLVGRAGGPPALSGLQVADLSGSLYAVIGILIALREAERTGNGSYLDIALFDSLIGSAVTAASSYFGTGKAPQRGEERHSGRYPFSDIYETSDGEYLTLCAIEGHFWRNLCKALGREDWIERQYVEGPEGEEMRTEMARIFRTRTRDQWFAELGPLDTCIAPVLSLGEALESEQATIRRSVRMHEHPEAGSVPVLSTPIAMSGVDLAVRRPAGRLGEDTDAVLRDLGYDTSTIAALHRSGAVSGPDPDAA